MDFERIFLEVQISFLWTFRNDVARDHFNTTLLCGRMGEFGNSAVHITYQEETRQPESTADITDYSDFHMDGARRHAKG